MCGIAGFLYNQPERQPDTGVLKRMCDVIEHRGPDDEGQTVLGPCGLGMRRLSIIDLSTGHQPLSNEDGTVWIVFNGEIYNFQELRPKLEALGHRFRTNTDTEVIVHGYEEWGEAICEKLNGMFGFAIWDSNKKKLFIARDRLGIKPLYYYQDEEKFLFGSELKSILTVPNVRKNLDLNALNNFLTFEYIPAPKSIFQDVRKLEPGHFLTVESGKMCIAPYWILEAKEERISENDAMDRLSELVTDSVKLRMISDVPLGAFLSGGIDSTVVVSHMAALSDRPVKTFSIGFKESSYNELKYARAVARDYQTEHHEFMVEADVLGLTEQLSTNLDEPFGDFSIFPTYLVSKMARDHVTVCLSGDGGDELFAGYDTYKAHLFERQYYSWWPQWLKTRIVEPITRNLTPTEQKKGLINSIKRFAEGAALPDELMHARWMTFINASERAALFTPEAAEVVHSEDPYQHLLRYSAQAAGTHDITRTGFVDIKSYLVDNILVKVDRMSMAPSLEARVPLLDHRIVEFAMSLPPELKMKGLGTKYLLKKTFYDKLPVEVQNRDKQGFSIPIKNWIRGDLKPMMMDLLDSKRLKQQGIFNETFVHQLIDEHVQGRQNHSHKLWALMMFQQWARLYNSA